MAAVQLTGAVYPLAGGSCKLGPFDDGAGNLWAFAFYDGSDTVYVLLVDSSHVMHIYSFTLSTHTWNAEVYSSGTRPTVLQDVNSHYVAIMDRRSTGEFCIIFQGALHNTTKRTAQIVRVSSAGVYSAVTSLATVSTVDYDARDVVIGASDRAHFILTHSNNRLSHRSLSSGNTLDTIGDASSSVHTEASMGRGFYNADLAKLVAGPFSTGDKVARCTSGANPTWTDDTNAVGTVSNAFDVAFAHDDVANKLYALYRNSSNNDLYYNTCDDAGTTWGTEALLETGTVTAVSATKISGGVGYLFQDSGVWFNKLSVGAVANTKNLGGGITPTGKAVRAISRRVFGGFTPAGRVSKAIARAVAGTVSSSGKASRSTSTHRAGAMTPAGKATRQTSKREAGSMTPAGRISKAIARAVAGTLTPSGRSIRSTSTSRAGSIPSAGKATRQTSTRRTGAIAPAAAAARATSKSEAGSLTPSGHPARQTAKRVAGALTPSGALSLLRVILLFLGGTIAPSGVVRRAASKGLHGALSAAGSCRRAAARGYGGAIALAGAARRQTSKGFAGAVGLAGRIGKVIGKFLVGLITPAGSVSNQGSGIPNVNGTVTLSSSIVDVVGLASSAIATVGLAGSTVHTVDLIEAD
jgi:hypothetical protein